MKKYDYLLTQTRLFQGIGEQEIGPMLECLQFSCKKFEKGETVYRREEQIQEVALLLEGRIHIRKEDYWGNLSILREISPGEVFGEVYACLGSEMHHDAVAIQPSTVLFLNTNRILTVCTSACQFHTRLIRNLLSVIASKNLFLTQKLEHMSQRSTREKLLSYLSEQAQRAGKESFDIPFNRQQLADFLAVDRSAMSNELSKMRKEGILEFERNHFLLKNPLDSDLTS